jgi:hypothetical protein
MSFSETNIFVPIISRNKYGDKIYECPICPGDSGSLLIITHYYLCPNKGKTPVERKKKINLKFNII